MSPQLMRPTVETVCGMDWLSLIRSWLHLFFFF